MDELLAGRLTFKVKNSQGNIVNGTVVQYQSSDYYVQADGSLLWQVQPIQHSSNTLILTASQTITSGFSLQDVQIVNIPITFGYYLDGTTAYLAVKMIDDSVKVIESSGECFTGSVQGEGANTYGAFAFSPSPIYSGDAIAFTGAVDKRLAPIETISSSIIAENDKWLVEVAGKRFELDLIPEDGSPLRVYQRVQ